MLQGRRVWTPNWKLYVVGIFARWIRCVDRRGRQQYVVRIDVLCEPVVQIRLHVLRRITDEVEYAVALEAVIVDTAAGADDEGFCSPGDVPCDTETRSPLRSTVLLQVLVDALAALKQCR